MQVGPADELRVEHNVHLALQYSDDSATQPERHQPRIGIRHDAVAERVVEFEGRNLRGCARSTHLTGRVVRLAHQSRAYTLIMKLFKNARAGADLGQVDEKVLGLHGELTKLRVVRGGSLLDLTNDWQRARVHLPCIASGALHESRAAGALRGKDCGRLYVQCMHPRRVNGRPWHRHQWTMHRRDTNHPQSIVSAEAFGPSGGCIGAHERTIRHMRGVVAVGLALAVIFC